MPDGDAKPMNYEQMARLDQMVHDFTKALKEKLHKAEAKYQHGEAWRNGDWKESCIRQLHEHIVKVDPLDVAAYCAFAWYHGWSLAPSPVSDSERQDWIEDINWLIKGWKGTVDVKWLELIRRMDRLQAYLAHEPAKPPLPEGISGSFRACYSMDIGWYIATDGEMIAETKTWMKFLADLLNSVYGKGPR
jgi:hypothetical protein